MARLTEDVTKAYDNIVYTKSGDVIALYMLRGFNIKPYNPDTLNQARAAHIALIRALAMLPIDGATLTGFKEQIDPDATALRIVRGLGDIPKGFSFSKEYPEFAEQVKSLRDDMQSGRYRQFRRNYVLGVKLPSTSSVVTDILADYKLIANKEVSLSKDSIKEIEKVIFTHLPREFMPQRTTPYHLRWMHDRQRLRGVRVPQLPLHIENSAVNTRSFAQIEIDSFADVTRTFADFKKELETRGARALRKNMKRSFLANFRAARRGQTIAVHSLEEKNRDGVSDTTSYQKMMTISQYPTKFSDAVNSFTYLVDQNIGLDADFSMRFTFDQSIISKETKEKFYSKLNAEGASNDKSQFDVRETNARRSEFQNFIDALDEETSPVGMKVCTTFAFGSDNLEVLEEQVQRVVNTFTQAGYITSKPVGGQVELFNCMLPFKSHTSMIKDYQQSTTAEMFSGFIPIRRTEAGDDFGIPIGINKENALGQIVLYDILHATDQGNASIAMTGDQGSGKSNMMKMLAGYFIDMKRYIHIIDNSQHGEYAVFMKGFAKDTTQVVDVTGGKYSIDPLKIYKDDPEHANEVFLSMMFALMNISPKDPVATALTEMCSTSSREYYGLHTAGDVVKEAGRLSRNSKHHANLYSQLRFWSQQPYASAIFDPLDPQTGNARVLPPINIGDNNHCVVFRTQNLKLPTPNQPVKPLQNFSRVIYTLIAEMTKTRFKRIKGACSFFGEEMSFVQDKEVLFDLIQTPDRTGRKDSNSVVTCSQLDKEYGPEFDMIQRKLVFRQRVRDNAVSTMTWGGIPPLPTLVTRLTTDTSPADPNRSNVPIRGREGEGWYNDGNGSIIRIKTLEQPLENRRRLADTTSSRMIREEEIQ